jgi:hypothetical protein
MFKLKFKRFIENNFLIIKYPEYYLNKSLNENPFYPFCQLDAYVFEYKYRKYSIAFLYLIASIFYLVSLVDICRILFKNSIELPNRLRFKCFSIIIICILSILSIFCLILSVYQLILRKICIDLIDNKYEFYLGNRLVHTSSLNHMYIRLNMKTIVRNKVVYRLCIFGRAIDTIVVSNYSYNDVKLRQLGYKIAQNLAINYFDTQDLSEYHEIFNYSARESMPNQKLNIKSDNIYWLKPNLYLDDEIESKKSSIHEKYTQKQEQQQRRKSILTTIRSVQPKRSYRPSVLTTNSHDSETSLNVKYRLTKLAHQMKTLNIISK